MNPDDNRQLESTMKITVRWSSKEFRDLFLSLPDCAAKREKNKNTTK